jgi:hypothetical protein
MARRWPARIEPALSEANILWGLLFGSIGLGFFMYGRKQQRAVPLICGLLLMVYPYFIPNTPVLVAIGAALVATPYFLRL